MTTNGHEAPPFSSHRPSGQGRVGGVGIGIVVRVSVVVGVRVGIGEGVRSRDN